MTTKIKIENDATSNGDVVVRAIGVSGDVFVTEAWPTKKPAADAA